MDLEVEVETESLERLEEALEDGVEEGARDTVDWALDKAEDKAQDVIWQKGRIWNTEVYNGFIQDQQDLGQEHVGVLYNMAPHADIVNMGRRPGRKPQVQDIIEWVDDKLLVNLMMADGGFSDDDYDGGLDDGYVVETVTKPDALGLSSNDFNSSYVRGVQLDDGTDGVWKSHQQQPGGSDAGSVANEVVWSRAREDLNWGNDPRSRIDTFDIDGTEYDGTLQEFAEGSSPIEEIYFGYTNYDGSRMTRDEFMEENMDWFAETAALDIIFGNTDRHRKNFKIAPDGTPLGIDNGGYDYNDGFDRRSFNPEMSMDDFGDAINPDELLERNDEYLDRLYERLMELSENETWQYKVLEWSKKVHGEDSQFHERLEIALGDGDFDGTTSPWDNNVPLFAEDPNTGNMVFEDLIYVVRDQIHEKYEQIVNGDDSSTGIDDTDDFDSSPIGGDIDDMMNDLMGDLS
jgi:hypothetical protein